LLLNYPGARGNAPRTINEPRLRLGWRGAE
jgi:hypothetical protein